MDLITLAVANKFAKAYTDSQIENADFSSMSYYCCSSSEYNSSTGVPTISSPDANTFYITPAINSNGVYNMYIYKNNQWVLFHTCDIDLTEFNNELTSVKQDLSEKTLETVLPTVGWEQGFIRAATGVLWEKVAGYIRSSNYVGAKQGLKEIYIKDGYLANVFAWNNGSYVGIYDTALNTFVKATSGSFRVLAFDFTKYPTYKFKICLYRNPFVSTTLDLVEGVNCVFRRFTDDTLMIQGVPADSKSTGDMVYAKHNYLSGWVNQGYTGASNAKRLSLFLPQNEAKKWGKVIAPDGYSVGISGNKQYIWDGETWTNAHTFYRKSLDLSNINLQYSTIGFTICSDGTEDIPTSVGEDVIFCQRPLTFEDIGANEFHVGSGQEYTRLRDGISAAVSKGNATVYVHPGVYDLLSEFANEIQAATGDVGIALGNNVRVAFCDGAKVTALFDNSESTYDSTTWRWIYDSFQPFYSVDGDFVLENLEIEAKDTRYCVHDEMIGSGTHKHEYINCRMTYTNTHEDINYVQCIGGGLGEHGTIIVDGGWYKSITEYGIASVGGDVENSQQPITFHNGNNSSADSSIIIKNVYLADRGYFRFGWYGSSTTKSQVQISGCGVGLPALVKAEGTASVRNFELTEFGIDKRNAYHWEVSANGRTASLVADS